ncbi:MAG: DUF2784 domain-containing protein [Gemmatimonadota bacterium]|nr:DUF2784 domain-containing protein [Gemmatimonadota bacterium]
MLFRIGADALVVSHLAFIVFVIVGGFLAWRWRWLAWVHVPCALWGAIVELMGWICPLTPWEVALRRQAGQAGYESGFVEHYIIPIVYPGALTPSIQIGLGVSVIAINGLAYWVYFRRRAAR